MASAAQQYEECMRTSQGLLDAATYDLRACQNKSSGCTARVNWYVAQHNALKSKGAPQLNCTATAPSGAESAAKVVAVIGAFALGCYITGSK